MKLAWVVVALLLVLVVAAAAERRDGFVSRMGGYSSLRRRATKTRGLLSGIPNAQIT